MPQSLKVRLGEQTKEVIEYTRNWGQIKAMDKYGIKSLIAFEKFLGDETGNPDFGIRPVFNSANRGNWAEDLLDAFTNKVLRLEAEKQHLSSECERLHAEVEYLKAHKANHIEPMIQRAIEACK